MTAERAPAGRRERNKADKRERIFTAADRLFAERGYDAVTTQQIADAADVGTGTVFRYFPTKADLLVEVMSGRLRLGAARAQRLAESGADPVDAILALVQPLLRASGRHPENTNVFQREVLFGAQGGDDRRINEVANAEAAIEQILVHSHPETVPDLRRDAAHVIYALLYVDVVRAARAQGSDHRHLRETVRHNTALALGSLLGDARRH